MERVDGLSAEAVVKSYLASFSSGDPEQVLQNIHPEFVNEHLGFLGNGCSGKGVYAERLKGFLGQFRNINYQLQNCIEQSSSVVCRYRFQFNQQGKPFDIPGIMWFEILDGLIVRRIDCWDGLNYVKQGGMGLDDLAELIGVSNGS